MRQHSLTCLKRPDGLSVTLRRHLWHCKRMAKWRTWIQIRSAANTRFTLIRASNLGGSHDKHNNNRMDRANVEPDHGMHEDFARLQALLRRGHGNAATGHGGEGV